MQDAFVKEEPSTAVPASEVPPVPTHHTVSEAPAVPAPAAGQQTTAEALPAVFDADAVGVDSAAAQMPPVYGGVDLPISESKPAAAAASAPGTTNGGDGAPEASGNASGEPMFWIRPVI